MAFSEISVHDAKQLLDSPTPLRLIDCRELDEYTRGHLENAELIPYPTFMTEAPGKLTNHEEIILIYCHHGVRSAYAADLLTRLGYADVRTMAGGIEAWSNEIDPAMPRY